MATMKMFANLPISLMGGPTAGETLKIDWLSDTLKCALYTAAFSPSQTLDKVYAGTLAGSGSVEVANGLGYTTGGNAVTPQTPTLSSLTCTFDVTDPTAWTATGAGFALRYAVFYDSTSTVLLGYIDYGSTLTLAAAATLTITIDAAGLFTVTVP